MNAPIRYGAALGLLFCGLMFVGAGITSMYTQRQWAAQRARYQPSELEQAIDAAKVNAQRVRDQLQIEADRRNQ